MLVRFSISPVVHMTRHTRTCKLSTGSTPVTLVLFNVSAVVSVVKRSIKPSKKEINQYMRAERNPRYLTFRSITRLIILGKPSQIQVLDPRHPVLFLMLIAFCNPLRVALALLLLLGQRIKGLLLLVLAHLRPFITTILATDVRSRRCRLGCSRGSLLVERICHGNLRERCVG